MFSKGKKEEKKNTGFMANLFETVSEAYGSTKDIFNSAKPQAKLTGKMLACCLALGYPFKTQSISIITYSLGGQVIKSCLKTLHNWGLQDLGYNLFQNVTLIAGS